MGKMEYFYKFKEVLYEKGKMAEPKKVVRAAVAMAVIVGFGASLAPAANSFGSGKIEVDVKTISTSKMALSKVGDYYQIGSAAQYNEFAAGINGGSIAANAKAKLTSYIDFENGQVTQITKDFTGEIDGNKKTMYNFTGAPLVKTNKGTIKNLKTVDAKAEGDVTAEDGSQGIKMGIFASINEGTIEFCEAGGSVRGGQYTGGLVGVNYGKIKNCVNKASVYSQIDDIGGIAGANQKSGSKAGSIDSCINEGEIKIEPKLRSSYPYDIDAGGIVGVAFNGTVTNCKNTGKVTGSDHDSSQNKNKTIYIGGIAGEVQGGASVSNCNNMNSNVEKVVGRGNTTNCGNRSPELSITRPEFDKFEFKKDGDYYQIGSIAEYNEFAAGINDDSIAADAKAKLTGDIDFKNGQVTQITKSFYGEIDGNEKTMANFTGAPLVKINIGMIKNLRTVNAKAKGTKNKSDDCIGILVGDNMGTIENCEADGSVEGGQFTGGVAGKNVGGTIKNCVSKVNVTSEQDDVGGITGWINSGTVDSCINFGEVKSTKGDVGGIVGSNYNGGIVKNCKNVGSASGGKNNGGIAGENLANIYNCSNLKLELGIKYTGSGTETNCWNGTQGTDAQLADLHSNAVTNEWVSWIRRSNGILDLKINGPFDTAMKTVTYDTNLEGKTIEGDAKVPGGQEIGGSVKIKISKFSGKDGNELNDVYATKDNVKYKFIGWAESKDATDVQYQVGAEVEFKEDKTLYAVWQGLYKVTYDANGKTLEGDAKVPGEQEIDVSGKIKISKFGDKDGNELNDVYATKDGVKYAFIGWAESQEATAAQYQVGAEVEFKEDKILYAVWQVLNLYKVTYDANLKGKTLEEGITLPESQEVLKEVKVSNWGGVDSGQVIYAVGSNGVSYVFDGWSYDDRGMLKTVNANDLIQNLKSDITLKAKWTKTYVVTYISDGKVIRKDNYNTTTQIIRPDDPIKDGYKFVTWKKYAAAGLKADYWDEGEDYNVDRDVTFIAVWEEDESTESVNESTGSVDEVSEQVLGNTPEGGLNFDSELGFDDEEEMVGESVNTESSKSKVAVAWGVVVMLMAAGGAIGFKIYKKK